MLSWQYNSVSWCQRKHLDSESCQPQATASQVWPTTSYNTYVTYDIVCHDLRCRTVTPTSGIYWKPDHLAHFSIWEHILRCTLYIMRYTMLPYNSVWKSRKSYISGYTQYISTYTIGKKYISIIWWYTEIYFWPIVYVEIYYYMCNSVYVRISRYEIFK